MLLAEPPPTQGDIHFQLAGTPVRIHPFFWLTTALLGLSSPPAELLVWVGVVAVSILIHEFGHALAQRYYGGNPRVVLHGFGGLSICNDCDRSTLAQIVISLGGPVAGFLFAAVALALVGVSGHAVGVHWGQGEIPLAELGLDQARVIQLPGLSLYWQPLASDFANNLLVDVLWVNGLWGAVNLLPIYPLDGGHIAREVCMIGRPRQGLMLSLQISLVAAIAMAFVGLSWRSLLVAFFFGYLAYTSYRTLEVYRNG